MSARNKQGLDQSLRRLEELIGALEAHPEAPASESARELISLILNLHGIGLAKLMAILAKAEGGAATIARLVEDDQVRAILLLHGLHPDDMETRVHRAIDRLRPHLGVHGLRIEILEIARGVLRLRLSASGGIAVKASTLLTLPGEIEDAIVEAAPDVDKVIIDGLDLTGSIAAVNAGQDGRPSGD
jgi:Fe-S cluster biogenesis protein NfuA